MGMVRGVPAFMAAAVLVATPSAVAVEDTDSLPASIVALGDSITRGFNACGFYKDCPRESWSTGSEGGVNSHRLQLERLGATLRQANVAKSGARSNALAGQAAQAVQAGADYVTIEIGANDACASSESDMTSVRDFRRNIQAGLAVLRAGVPGARIYVASIPDLRRLWALGHTSWYIRKVWAELGVCPSMLARPNSQDLADVHRRDRVRTRIIQFNKVLAEECAAFGQMCWFDRKAVFRTSFTRAQLSKWDYFHPNPDGQRLLAEVTFEPEFFVDVRN